MYSTKVDSITQHNTCAHVVTLFSHAAVLTTATTELSVFLSGLKCDENQL